MGKYLEALRAACGELSEASDYVGNAWHDDTGKFGLNSKGPSTYSLFFKKGEPRYTAYPSKTGEKYAKASKIKELCGRSGPALCKGGGKFAKKGERAKEGGSETEKRARRSAPMGDGTMRAGSGN
jgi:hypothetical protein